MARMCCARTSSAPGRNTSGSSSPSSIASSAARASRYSKRLPGTMMPLLGSSRRWLARPMRCSRRELPFGAPIWTTRSTSPQSMPRSRLAVATSPRSSPGGHRRLDLPPRFDREAAVVNADRKRAHRSPSTAPGRSARRDCAYCRTRASSCAARSAASLRRAAWRPEWPPHGILFSGIRIERSGSAPGSPMTRSTSSMSASGASQER